MEADATLNRQAAAVVVIGTALAGFGSVFALFAVSRLYPGKKSRPATARTTDDQFVLVIDQTDASFDVNSVQEMLAEFNTVGVEEHVEEGGR